jgi:CHAT domain-containing protein
LTERKEALESQLSHLDNGFHRAAELQKTSYTHLVRELPDDAAIVDVIETSLPWRNGQFLREYEAFICRPTSEPLGGRVVWVRLGPAPRIDSAVSEWRAEIASHDPRASERERNLARSLRQLIWKAIEPHLSECQRVVIIPDSKLCFVPWSALPGRHSGTYLIEDYAISTVSHGQLLYDLLTRPKSSADGLLLVGGVDYDKRLQPADPAASTLTSKTRAPAVDKWNSWGNLPGTSKEASDIRELHTASDTICQFKGRAATEAALCEQMPNSRFVHLATHGFFADARFQSMFSQEGSSESLHDTVPTLMGSGQPAITASLADVTVRNPLILSGVVLSGANLPPEVDQDGLPTGEDGVLTAEEIVSLDLRKTELVVLSACETGLGRVAGGEGVLGLQRAFHLAGARSVVASLWKLDDHATSALMGEFYKNLWHNQMGKLEALRAAQLAVIRRYDAKLGRLRGSGPTVKVDPKKLAAARLVDPTAHKPLLPFFWAGFVLSGDWR